MMGLQRPVAFIIVVVLCIVQFAWIRFRTPHSSSQNVDWNSKVAYNDNGTVRRWTNNSELVNHEKLQIHQNSSLKNLEYFNNHHSVRVFVYEDLPATLTTDIEQCKLEPTLPGVWKKRNNFMADIPIIELFKGYKGRTWDPTEADVFVVPYPHKSHCTCNLQLVGSQKPGLHCTQVPDEDIELLFSSLAFFNKTTRDRHLFVLSGDFGWSNKRLEMMPLLLTLGPKPENRAGAIVVPYLNDRDEFKPSAIRQRPAEWWTTRPRKFSFAYFYGGHEFRRIRAMFRSETKQNYGKTLGGMPFVIKSIQQWTPKEQAFVFETYRQSVFCPCLAGDNAPQKRFFDVAMSGCLPVVLSFSPSRHPDWKSWFRPRGPSLKASYPFAKSNFNNGLVSEIDYESFVVQVPGNVSNVKPTLEAILADPEDLRRRQKNLGKFASFFSYGTGDDAYRYPDAFSGITESISHYLDGIQSGSSTSTTKGIARYSLPNGPRTKPRPRLKNQLLDRFIVVPEFKLLFCYVEKVGCSMFNHLFRMIRIHQPEVASNTTELEIQARRGFMRNTPQKHGITRDQLEKMLVDPNWTKAVFYRDPVLRFLSAFRSKCERGHDASLCRLLFGNTSMTFDQVLERIKHQKLMPNPHTLPASYFCGDLSSTLYYYDFVHELDSQTAPLHISQLLNQIGVNQDLIQSLTERIVRSGGTDITEDEEYVASLGVRLQHGYPQEKGHNTGSKNALCQYYNTPEKVRLIEEFYSVDYDTFQFAPRDVNCSF